MNNLNNPAIPNPGYYLVGVTRLRCLHGYVLAPSGSTYIDWEIEDQDDYNIFDFATDSASIELPTSVDYFRLSVNIQTVVLAEDFALTLTMEDADFIPILGGSRMIVPHINGLGSRVVLSASSAINPIPSTQPERSISVNVYSYASNIISINDSTQNWLTCELFNKYEV